VSVSADNSYSAAIVSVAQQLQLPLQVCQQS